MGCEACHGPGSQHVESVTEGGAVLPLPVPWPARNRWHLPDGARLAAPLREATSHATAQQEVRQPGVEQCSRCHSLRAELADHVPGQPFLAGYAPVPMTREIFHADGQVRGESFVWGAFVQSKMFAAGVDCGDCHNPHSGALRAPGDAVCGQCHQSAHYADADHRGHADLGTASPACVDCHMREVTVMSIDRRRDHSFRVPRPDLADIGGPSACRDCHTQPESWLAAAIQRWRDKPTQASSRDVVSSALAALWQETPDAPNALRRALSDPTVDPYSQFTAASAMGLSASQLAQAGVGGELTWQLLTAAEQAYRPGPHNIDRADGQIARALRRLQQQDVTGALAALNRALKIDPNNTRAALLKAEVIESRDGAEAAVKLLESLTARSDLDDSAVGYAIGLIWIRAQSPARAGPWFESARRSAPEVPTYALAEALLHSRADASAASLQQAADLLREARRRHPRHGELLRAEIDVLSRLGQRSEAEERLTRYLELGGDERWANQISRRFEG